MNPSSCCFFTLPFLTTRCIPSRGHDCVAENKRKNQLVIECRQINLLDTGLHWVYVKFTSKSLTSAAACPPTAKMLYVVACSRSIIQFTVVGFVVRSELVRRFAVAVAVADEERQDANAAQVRALILREMRRQIAGRLGHSFDLHCFGLSFLFLASNVHIRYVYSIRTCGGPP